MLPVLLAWAAMTPTRNEPWFSAKTSGVTFLAWIESSSMIAKLVSGNSAATFFSGGGVGEPDRDDGVVAALGEQAEPLLLLGVRLALGGLELLGLEAELRLGLVQAARRRVVERLVATAADVVGHADLELLGGRRVALPPAAPALVEPLDPLLDEPQALSARAAVAASARTLVTRRKGVSFAVLGPGQAAGPPGAGHACTGVDSPEGNSSGRRLRRCAAPRRKT